MDTAYGVLGTRARSAVLACPRSSTAVADLCSELNIEVIPTDAIRDMERAGGLLSCLRRGLGSIIGAVALDAGDVDHLSHICTMLNEILPSKEILIYTLSAGRHDREAFLKWLIGRLDSHYSLVNLSYSETQLALAELRIEHQALCAAFGELESAVSHYKLPTRVLIFQATGDVGKIALPAAPAGTPVSELTAFLVQALPVPATGLTGVEIYLETVERDVSGSFVLLLTAVDDQQILFAETRDASALFKGWQSFELPAALLSDEKHVALRMAWIGKARHAPTLRLALKTPLERYMIRRESDPHPSVIAMRLWWNIPGVRRYPERASPPASALTAGAGESRGLDQRQRTYVPVSELASVMSAGSLHETDKLDRWVIYEKKRGQIRIHPEANNVIYAAFPLSALGDPARISGSFLLDNENSRPVEFAMATVDASRLDDEVNNLTNWITLSAREAGDITIDVAPNVNVHSTALVIATRMANYSGSNAYAHAKLNHITTIGKI